MEHIKNEKIRTAFYNAGLNNDLGEFSRLITLHKIRNHAVREANELFNSGKNYKEPVDLTSKETLKKIMIRAWEITRLSVERWGGKAKDFFNEALRISWLEVKYS